MQRLALPFVGLALLASPLLAQGDLLKKAPPGVEEVLRARMGQFYGLVQEKKYRASESLVCEASKDDYYNANKSIFTAYEIVNITWEDEFRTARAAIVFDTDLSTRAGKIPVKMPITTMWKLEGGNWCYYLPPPTGKGIVTPFGIMAPGGGDLANQGLASLPKPVDPAAIMRQVGAVPSAIRFKAYESGSAEVSIENSLDGSVRVELMNDVARPGITLSLSKQELGPKDHAVLKVAFETKDRKPKNPFRVRILVSPLNYQLEIPVSFTLAPEDESKIPNEFRPKP